MIFTFCILVFSRFPDSCTPNCYGPRLTPATAIRRCPRRCCASPPSQQRPFRRTCGKCQVRLFVTTTATYTFSLQMGKPPSSLAPPAAAAVVTDNYLSRIDLATENQTQANDAEAPVKPTLPSLNETQSAEKKVGVLFHYFRCLNLFLYKLFLYFFAVLHQLGFVNDLL